MTARRAGGLTGPPPSEDPGSAGCAVRRARCGRDPVGRVRTGRVCHSRVGGRRGVRVLGRCCRSSLLAGDRAQIKQKDEICGGATAAAVAGAAVQASSATSSAAAPSPAPPTHGRGAGGVVSSMPRPRALPAPAGGARCPRRRPGRAPGPPRPTGPGVRRGGSACRRAGRPGDAARLHEPAHRGQAGRHGRTPSPAGPPSGASCRWCRPSRSRGRCGRPREAAPMKVCFAATV